jgi:dTMP kinase
MVLTLMARGWFITLEGIEGSGKTTQVSNLAEALRSSGKQVIITREPGGTRAGELIRAIFLDGTISLEITAELLLVLADRAQHVREKLRPALAAGQVVISDRYSDSTIAYQGYGRGLDLQLVRQFNRLASDGIAPDITIVLDCPVEVGLARTRVRASNAACGHDRFEAEQIDFHRRVRNGFCALAAEEPSRVVLVDSSRELQQVGADIVRVVLERTSIGR